MSDPAERIIDHRRLPRGSPPSVTTGQRRVAARRPGTGFRRSLSSSTQIAEAYVESPAPRTFHRSRGSLKRITRDLARVTGNQDFQAFFNAIEQAPRQFLRRRPQRRRRPNRHSECTRLRRTLRNSASRHAMLSSAEAQGESSPAARPACASPHAKTATAYPSSRPACRAPCTRTQSPRPPMRPSRHRRRFRRRHLQRWRWRVLSQASRCPACARSHNE